MLSSLKKWLFVGCHLQEYLGWDRASHYFLSILNLLPYEFLNWKAYSTIKLIINVLDYNKFVLKRKLLAQDLQDQFLRPYSQHKRTLFVPEEQRDKDMRQRKGEEKGTKDKSRAICPGVTKETAVGYRKMVGY